MLCSKSPTLHRTSAAAELVLSNDDLLLEILLRLPIQSLLPFKSVSKRWLSLISNPNFARRQSISRPRTTGIFLSRPCPDSPAFDFINLTSSPSRAPFEFLNFTDQKHGILILQSCNGLWLCSSSNRNYSERDYYVHNPTTKRFSKLPSLKARKILGLNLAFDPSRSSDYKVICVRNSDSFTDNYQQIEIYSSNTGPWRPCQGVFSAPLSMRFNCGVYWNRAVHWISTYENCLYLDLDEEKLHELPMPRVPDGWEERRVEYFGNCGGNLYLIEIYEPRDLQFNVYEMEEDRSGWFVKYVVDLRFVSAAFPKMVPSDEELELGYLNKFSVMAIVDNGIEVDEEPNVVLLVDEEVVRVDAKSGRFESLGEIENGGTTYVAIFPVGFGHDRRIDAHLYIESLACV